MPRAHPLGRHVDPTSICGGHLLAAAAGFPACTVAAIRSFPVGNGEALAREIPGARLLGLERAATAIPTATGEVAAAMLAL